MRDSGEGEGGVAGGTQPCRVKRCRGTRSISLFASLSEQVARQVVIINATPPKNLQNPFHDPRRAVLPLPLNVDEVKEC